MKKKIVKEVLLLKGLPGSGKTTYAKELQKANPGKYKRVNKDDLRAMMDDGKYSKVNEKFVNQMRDAVIGCGIADGFSVIVDDTNFNPIHEKNIRSLVDGFNKMVGEDFGVRVIVFDTPLDECKKRNAVRKDKAPVPEKVIDRMFKTYLKSSVRPKEVMKIEDRQNVVLCDLDGTLALHNGRSPYDASECGGDSVNRVVRDILAGAVINGNRIVFITGRSAKHLQPTLDWLEKHVDKAILSATKDLLMRPDGDQRPDFIVKKELYDSFVKHKYNVSFVLEDRDQVVKMWRELGLTCLQVADGSF